jgi:hypothetical protein
MTKRLLGWIIVLGLPLIGIAAFKTVKESFLTVRTSKNLSFKLYKTSNYTAQVYDSTAAQIEITVEKVNGRNREKVWDTTFGPCLLKKYPSIEKAFLKTITVSNVIENREQLELNYVIVYNTRGNILQVRNGPYILNDEGELNIDL